MKHIAWIHHQSVKLSYKYYEISRVKQINQTNSYHGEVR